MAVFVILPDQLSRSLNIFHNFNLDEDVIFMGEFKSDWVYVPHHKKKLAFIFSSMRHFAHELKQDGFNVVYRRLDDKTNSQVFENELRKLNCNKIKITEPNDYNFLQRMLKLKDFDVEIIQDNRFLCTKEEFSNWAKGKKVHRMEFFYRLMRKKHNLLLDENGLPIGGKWNFDKLNRKTINSKIQLKKRISHKKSQITKDVLELVEIEFPKNFGTLKSFYYAVTREQALKEMNDFIENFLPDFGEYQDAMVLGEPYLFHSLLSSYLNVGLLNPIEVCQSAQNAFLEGKVSINSAEGFIRQILGWREFIRGIYWSFMPEYSKMNFLEAKNPLPWFYWNGDTDMMCISEVMKHTIEHSYSHHIQRLMVTGNFALIAGLDVKEVQDWYLAVYSDAFDWVEMPNTLGMSLYGDGGIVGSKPYASTGAYINKMSNFCKNCKFDVKKTYGENACPFNFLYWNFLVKHRKKFITNGRMSLIYKAWEGFDNLKKEKILVQAQEFLDNLFIMS
jgi:deoxyribodipyrimidine photolyase-related protein